MSDYLKLIVLENGSEPILAEIKAPQDYRLFGGLKDMSYRRDDDPEIPERPDIETYPHHQPIRFQGKEITRDGHGQLLRFAYPRDLTAMDWGQDEWGRAIQALLQQLSDNFIVSLYWY